ncbi:MAG: hypothetical protein L0332_25475 [Chloroflexi bacterium]|nr:hypothetical protein [Chloroflexota bacterium]MCI0730049.1 hypothetical protein [Chloroflexota bacterium]
MKVALLRVGIDTGSGRIHGPLFQDGSFEFLPIPDGFGIDSRTYGNTTGRKGRNLLDYFPRSRQSRARDQSLHLDPEFTTFTYGDPTRPKAGLRHLEKGDMLIFYCGLEGWDFPCGPALYLIGYFEVLAAGRASDFSREEIRHLFAENFHVRHQPVYERQAARFVLVKGSMESRLLRKAVLISDVGRDRRGRPLKVLSADMQEIFGDFGGKISLQRSPPRWVHPTHVEKAARFVRSLG